MNILFIANKLNIQGGGSNQSLNLMTSFLCERGHNVTIATLNIRTDNEIPKDAPYRVRSHQSSSQVEIIRTILDVLKEYEGWADLVHCFFSPFIPICGLYRRRGGKTPIVGRLNNYIMFCTNPSKMERGCHENCSTVDKIRHDERTTQAKLWNIPFYMARTHAVPRLASEVDRMFAITPAVKRIHATNGINPDSIVVVPNFHDPVHDNKSVRSSDHGLGWGPDRFDVLYVGRIVREKGVDLLIDAAQRINKPDLRFHVVGDGELRSPLERYAEQAGVGDSVIFHGHVDYDDLPRYYEEADLFIHPGRWPEPFGRTILEAMQHGCPLLVSDVGGPPWIAGSSGVTFESESAVDLTRKLSALCGNDSRLVELSENCAEEFDRFDRETVVTEIERHYCSVLS